MNYPLCVDLDGTLIYNDVTLIAYGDYICGNQFKMLNVLFWLTKGGRAYMKHRLADEVEISPHELTYNIQLIRYIKDQKQQGRKIVLATACNYRYANCIADHVGIFDEVFASDQYVNLRAKTKANKLVHEFGDKAFSYAGNSKDDLHVWAHAYETILVNPAHGVERALKKNGRHYTLIN